MTTSIESFDDFDEVYGSEYAEIEDAQPPFQFRKDKSEKGTLEWLQTNFEISLKASYPRIDWYREASALYKGDADYNIRETGKKPKHVVNFIQDMLENKVAARARISPNLTVIPEHDEQKSINSSRGAKKLLDYNAKAIDLETKLQEQDRRLFKFGTGILHTFWNKDIGPLHPKYKALRERHGNNIPKSVSNKIKGSIRVGDVDVEELSPAKFFPERFKKKWGDIDYVDTIDFENIYLTKAEYPAKADLIELDDSNILLSLRMTWDNNIVKHLFYHRPTKHFPKGARIVWCHNTILEWTDFPFEHGELPFDVAVDIPLEGIFGMSFISNIKQLQRTYNNIQSATAYDISSVARKKWMVYKNSARFQSLANEDSVVEWSGKNRPELVTNTPMTTGMQPFQDKIESNIAKLSRVYDISRGEAPAGVTANSALQFLDEQETNRDIVGIVNKKTRIRNIGRMRMSLMEQYYSKDDGRMLKILGSENEYLIESMVGVDFSLAYTVELENTSKLPDSKSGMISAIVDMNAMTQTDPVFKRDHVMQLLDMGNNDIFKSRASTAVTAAKTVLDALLSGGDAIEPQKSDDHMVYYDVFTRAIQGMTYRTNTDPDIKLQIENYIMVLEGLMYFRAQKNQGFLMQLLQLDMYPIYFTLPAPLMPIAPPVESGGAPDTTKIENLQNQFSQGEN